MTESEAKGFVQGKLDCMKKCDIFNKEDKHRNNECELCEYCYSQGNFGQQKEAFQMSINALEEVERYRNIGVISSYEMEQDLLLYKADREILNGYQELGTVEELKLAKEKQIAKKPILKHDVSVMHINRGNQPHEWKRLESDNWHCPECDSFVGERVYVHSKVHDQRKKKYCDNCGQKLDWSDKE